MDYTYDDYKNDEIDLKEIFYALWHRILIILLAGILGGAIAGAYTKYMMTPVYTSSSMLLVLTKETTLSSLADLQIGSQLTNDYSVMTTSRPVLEEVIDNLNLQMDYEELERMITISNPEDTRILEISVEHPSPQMAMQIVNELSEVASEFIGDNMEVVPPKIIEEGIVPTEKTSPSTMRNTLLGILAGLFISGGIVVLMTVLNDSIKNEDDVEKYLGLSTLASVPDRKDYIGGKKKKSGRKKSTRKKGDR